MRNYRIHRDENGFISRVEITMGAAGAAPVMGSALSGNPPLRTMPAAGPQHSTDHLCSLKTLLEDFAEQDQEDRDCWKRLCLKNAFYERRIADYARGKYFAGIPRNEMNQGYRDHIFLAKTALCRGGTKGEEVGHIFDCLATSLEVAAIIYGIPYEEGGKEKPA